LRYVNAGHNAPYILGRDGSHRRLTEGGSVLGVFAEQNFASGTAQLAPGDRVILFTDGVTEACNPEGQEFGEQRLLGILEAGRTLGAGPLREKILAEVAAFSGVPWTDDATLLVLAVGA
jgi:sigma-B regulation protein RsbU (phosphoserine phosphatase)